MVPAIVAEFVVDTSKVPPSRTIAVAVIAFLAVTVIVSAILILVTEIASLNTEALSISINVNACVPPIVFTKVLVAPVT
jgi:uncharacterized RDD family membrane protein YckC